MKTRCVESSVGSKGQLKPREGEAYILLRLCEVSWVLGPDVCTWKQGGANDVPPKVLEAGFCGQ